MLKKLVWKLIALIAITFSIYAVVVRGQTQTTPQFQIDQSSLQKDDSENKKRPVKVRNYSFGLSKYESPNGQALIERASFGNTTVITTEFDTKKLGKFEVEFTGNFTAPGDGEITEMYSSLGVKATKKQKNFDLAFSAQYFRSQRFSFGIMGIELSKEVVVRKFIKLTPFGNISYYLPTESSNNRVSPGWVLRKGVKTDVELEEIVFEFNTQMISDSGALHPGKRFGFNFEGNFLFKLPGFKAGPVLGYTSFLNGERGGTYGFALQFGR